MAAEARNCPPQPRSAVLRMALTLAAIQPAAAAEPLSLTEKASLQAAMQRYIDRGLVDRRYLAVDLASGEVRKLSPVAGHPMILRMGPYFVLCSDFRDDKGAFVNVDFYVASSASGYVVFRSEIGNRQPLELLMKAGKVAAL